jgi:hypothetical protein
MQLCLDKLMGLPMKVLHVRGLQDLKLCWPDLDGGDRWVHTEFVAAMDGAICDGVDFFTYIPRSR